MNSPVFPFVSVDTVRCHGPCRAPVGRGTSRAVAVSPDPISPRYRLCEPTMNLEAALENRGRTPRVGAEFLVDGVGDRAGLPGACRPAGRSGAIREAHLSQPSP